MNTLMTTSQQRAQMVALHEQAGARYGAAVREIEDAYIELLGVGSAASNNLVGAIPENDRLVPNPPLEAPVHPRFAPKPINLAAAHNRVVERRTQLLADLGINS